MGVYAEIIEWMKAKEEENTPPTDDLDSLKKKVEALEKQVAEKNKEPEKETKEEDILKQKIEALEKELKREETKETPKKAPTNIAETATGGLTMEDISKMSISELRKHQDIVDEVLQANK